MTIPDELRADVLAIAWVRRTVVDGCWSGPNHLQGANNKTSCGISYGLHWGFEFVEGGPDRWIGCGRCQKVITRRVREAMKGDG